MASSERARGRSGWARGSSLRSPTRAARPVRVTQPMTPSLTRRGCCTIRRGRPTAACHSRKPVVGLSSTTSPASACKAFCNSRNTASSAGPVDSASAAANCKTRSHSSSARRRATSAGSVNTGASAGRPPAGDDRFGLIGCAGSTRSPAKRTAGWVSRPPARALNGPRCPGPGPVAGSQSRQRPRKCSRPPRKRHSAGPG